MANRSSALLTADPGSSSLLSGRILITGGTGTLGNLLAEWFCQHGAKNLTLLSRTGVLPPNVAEWLATSASGSTSAITVCACDTTSAADCGVLSFPASDLQPVTLLVHAGGVLADAMLSNQSLGALRRVLAPKHASLEHLAVLAQLHPAAGQVLFSSIASLLGAPGQANYSAANAGLDGYAAECAARGLAAVSVQWGAWAGGGMAAQDAQTAGRVERMGMSLIRPQQGLAALEGVLSSMIISSSASILTGSPALESVIAANPFRWPEFLRRLPGPPPPFLSHFSITLTTKDTTSGAAVLKHQGRPGRRRRQHTRASAGPAAATTSAVFAASVLE
ncbi:hypothetical protein VaNZ11_006292, partial [Volvox africanus]